MTGSAALKIKTAHTAEIIISGTWKLRGRNDRPSAHIKKILAKGSIASVHIKANNLGAWDSSLINFLVKIFEALDAKNISVRMDEMPVGACRLVQLARTSEDAKVRPNGRARTGTVDFIKNIGTHCRDGAEQFAFFCGDLWRGTRDFIRGKTRIREEEFAVILQDVGVRALPIVTLISFLVGLIISFISILQLSKFGASIYVADLVGIAMMREMGCLMTGVIMSGRTGAAFAANIGAMVANDEVDALQTAGFSKVHFLVIPRVLALTMMMPLLCVFSSFVGVFGGLCSSMFMTKLTITQYCTQTANAVCIGDFCVGIVKSVFFGLLIASIGCSRGLRCGRSAEAVGLATTSAVVVSITAIIAADALFAVIFSMLNI
ncbi:MAG: ABC transporter permease [Puniceicoccales bacterium]|jgi:phospholipid/cholesterol/gamma-HCH transport system permease protein|nr:ABC transporter permease [Puniceicoccales bacterium]